MTEPIRHEPASTAVSEPFWEATRSRRLTVQWCLTCDRAIFYPRDVCPGCLGSTLEWRSSVGTGRVYAVTVEHDPPRPSMRDLAPYAVALVDLDDGWRMLTNIVGCEPDDVVVGMPVTVTWEPLSDGRNLPLFTPLAEATESTDA